MPIAKAPKKRIYDAWRFAIATLCGSQWNLGISNLLSTAMMSFKLQTTDQLCSLWRKRSSSTRIDWRLTPFQCHQAGHMVLGFWWRTKKQPASTGGPLLAVITLTKFQEVKKQAREWCIKCMPRMLMHFYCNLLLVGPSQTKSQQPSWHEGWLACSKKDLLMSRPFQQPAVL